jgi:hypothetical protein
VGGGQGACASTKRNKAHTMWSPPLPPVLSGHVSSLTPY